MRLSFPNSFELGVSSSATQIEGGELDHNWNDWYARGKITDGSNPARATDHYHLYKQDIDLMKSMGIRHYRLGVEWARIEPSENCFDENAIAHYRELLMYLRDRNISPLLTIHHFTNPMWFENLGGFTRPENIEVFLRYVKKISEAFADLVSEYITINEPNVYATKGFFEGIWPPGEKSIKRARQVMSIMSAAHIKSYELIHATRKELGYRDTKVGFANHVRVFDPKNPSNPMHKLFAYINKLFFQIAVSKACYAGVFHFPLIHLRGIEKGTYSDFIAINYYSRSVSSKIGDGVNEDSFKNDLGWEIYPEGLIECAKEMHSIAKLPIYITENGTCDNEDSFRCLYIFDHLEAILRSNLPIERYYHWSFCDNFEWAEGESARFGLVHVDFETQKRTVKSSGTLYSQMIEKSGVTEEMYSEFIAPQKYHK